MRKPKWLIAKPTLEPSDREYIWEHRHNAGYNKVYSMTDDAALRGRIVRELAARPRHQKILVPGCGSKDRLQKDIAKKVPGCKHVLCTDFPSVAAIPARKNRNRTIEYKGLDSGKLGIRKEFDAVVVVNSVISESDLENRKILAACFQALKPGGYLMGFFPTIFCSVDFAITSKSAQWRRYVKKRVDLDTFSEGIKGKWDTQIFYSPLLLDHILRETGFVRRKLEIYFLDTAYFLKEGRSVYGITDPDLRAYELFVTAQRPGVARRA
jgi:SAM-dependent methyltransferase